METPQEKLNRNNKLKADQLVRIKNGGVSYVIATQACDGLTGRSYEFDMGRLHFAEAVLAALKSEAPTNETGNARPGGE